MPDLDEQEANVLHLVDPDHISLTYGPDAFSAIQFGPKGGFEDGHWKGPKDHPLLPALLRDYPRIAEYGADTKTIYGCSECEATFATAAGVRGHFRQRHTPAVVK